MKRFEFGLQQLLELREQKERMVQLELAREQAELNRELMRKEHLLNERETAMRELGEMDFYKVNIQLLRYYDHFMQTLEWQAEQQDTIIESGRRRVHKVVVKLEQATKQRRIIEEIKKSEFQAWHKEAEHEAGLEMDEIASIRAITLHQVQGEGGYDIRN